MRLTLASLADKESQLRLFQQDHPFLVYGIAFLIYVAVTGFSLPGAAVLTLVFGWYFGFLRRPGFGQLRVHRRRDSGFSSQPFPVPRFHPKPLWRSAPEFQPGAGDEKDRSFLFTLRLIPAVPFFVINAVMGLTPIATRTFWWVSQLGMFPGHGGLRVCRLQRSESSETCGPRHPCRVQSDAADANRHRLCVAGRFSIDCAASR